MPGENLTRIEAEERAALVDGARLRRRARRHHGPEVFRSDHHGAVRRRRPARRRSSTRSPRAVHSVTLNGVALDPAEVSDGVRIQLPNLAAENELVVVADGSYMNTGEGLHRFVDPVDDEVYLYTQFEVPDSRRMFAVFEQPDLKATFRFTRHRAGALGGRVATPPRPSPSTPTTGAKTWAFAPTPRISSYITALVAGPYARRARRAHVGRRPRHPARRVQPQEPRRVPRRRLHLREDQAGLRVLRGEVRRARTRSRSTTSCSCPSTTRAPWRTRAR